MSQKLKLVLIVLLTMIINAGLDQVTKVIAREHIQGRGTIPVVGNVLVFVYAENTGAFLSLGADLPQPWKTIMMVLFPSIIVIASLAYIFLSKKMTMGQVIALSSVVAGGLSNLVDRILFNGAVTDFINMGIGRLRTGVLNVADLSITFGALVFVLLEFQREKREKMEDKQNP